MLLRIVLRVWVSGLLIVPNCLLLEKKLTSVYWLDSFPVKSSIASVSSFSCSTSFFSLLPQLPHSPLIACSIFILYWIIVDLQSCVRIRHSAKWFSYAYTCIHSFSNYFPILVIEVYWVEFLVLYSRSLLVIYFKYSSVGKSIPNSRFFSPTTFSLW